MASKLRRKVSKPDVIRPAAMRPEPMSEFDVPNGPKAMRSRELESAARAVVAACPVNVDRSQWQPYEAIERLRTLL